MTTLPLQTHLTVHHHRLSFIAALFLFDIMDQRGVCLRATNLTLTITPTLVASQLPAAIASHQTEQAHLN